MRKILVLLFLLPTLVFSQSKKNITLEDIWLKGTFSTKGFYGFNFMNNGLYYTEVKDNALLKKEVKTGNVISTLINDGDIAFEQQKVNLGEFYFSDDESKIIIRTENENIYRRSVKSYVYIYELSTKKTWILSPEKVLHPTFNPQGNKVAYVKTDNNIYIYDLISNKETAVTNDGLKNNIINGNCDWVSEEEFEFSKAFQWNATGDFIAYY